MLQGGETAALARLKYYLWDSDLLATYFDTVSKRTGGVMLVPEQRVRSLQSFILGGRLLLMPPTHERAYQSLRKSFSTLRLSSSPLCEGPCADLFFRIASIFLPQQHVQHQCTHTTCVDSPFDSMYNINVHTQHVWVPLSTACTTSVYTHNMCGYSQQHVRHVYTFFTYAA